MTELIRVEAGRPPYVLHEGARVFVAVHDEAHRIRRREFKRRIMELHPDRQTPRTFTIYVPARVETVKEHTVSSHVARVSRSADPTATCVRKAYIQPSHLRFMPAHSRRISRRFSTRTALLKVIKAYHAFLAEEREWYAQYGLGLPR